jgi:hypothetical protein
MMNGSSTSKNQVLPPAITDADSPPPIAAHKSHASNIGLVVVKDTPRLHDDSLFLIMEFLSPRELFCMAFTCKALRRKITVPLVVLSAMIHGGHALQSIKELSKWMNNYSIHPPSPLRLLRLVNGKRCEFCCQTPSPDDAGLLQRGHLRYLGTFACFNCFWPEGNTNGLVASASDDFADMCRDWSEEKELAYGSIVRHPRVAMDGLWRKPQTDYSGETIGPVVNDKDIQIMMKNHDAHNIVKQEYLQTMMTTLHLPPKNNNYYVEFQTTFEEMKKRADEVELERDQKQYTCGAHKRKRYGGDEDGDDAPILTRRRFSEI